MALSSTTQEAKFLLNLLSDLNISVQTAELRSDNQCAIALSKNPVSHKRSKHIDIRYHYVREQVLNGTIKLQYIPSDENLADMFTKPLAEPKLSKLVPCAMNL
jgi:KUP system potassium uptake protein